MAADSSLCIANLNGFIEIDRVFQSDLDLDLAHVIASPYLDTLLRQNFS